MQQKQKISHCHYLIAEVAQAAAYEMHEVAMRDNMIRAQWKRRHPGASEKALVKAFVRLNWSRCIPFARATLAGMLRNNRLDQEQKERIVEALALDATVMHQRRNPSIVVGEVKGGTNG